MRKTEYQKIILPQELRLLLIPMRETRAVTAYLVVGTGSRYEKKQENGLAHFLEHLFFKGTKKRPTALDLAKELDSIGASYNAFTSEEMTGFYIQAEASKQALILEILADILQNSLFQPEEIEREKRVIIEKRLISIKIHPTAISMTFLSNFFMAIARSVAWLLVSQRRF